MNFSPLTPELVVAFEAIVSPAHVLLPQRTEAAVYEAYGRDHTEDFLFPPDVVLRPGTTEEVSAIMRLCSAHRVPVTARGAGTGLSGAALPIHKGVLLSMERFNKIIAIDEQSLQATVEPGVVTEAFQNAVKEVGLQVPLVVRLEGTNVDLGKEIIAKSGLNVIAADDLSDAAEKIVKAVKG